MGIAVGFVIAVIRPFMEKHNKAKGEKKRYLLKTTVIQMILRVVDC